MKSRLDPVPLALLKKRNEILRENFSYWFEIMKRKKIIVGCIVSIVSLMGIYLAIHSGVGPAPVAKTPALSHKAQEADEKTGEDPLPGPKKVQQANTAKAASMLTKKIGMRPVSPQEEPAEPETKEYPKDIEEIKKQIYDLDIEHVEDMVLLDEVVQTGDADTQPLWGGDWISVDDFKGEDNGFNLEPQEDGTFIFNPDEETTRTYSFFESPKTYTYDAERKEFYWEEDYYGKTITHKAKFINENVLATMLISGNKVTLDIYQKYPDQIQ